MAKQPLEDEDKLRRRARRRLIGAITLTLIVVIALPMVLDSEPKPTAQDVDLRIPDKDKVAAFTPRMDAPVSAVAMAPVVVETSSAMPAVVQPPSTVTPLIPATSAPAMAEVAAENMPVSAPVKTTAQKTEPQDSAVLAKDKVAAREKAPPRSGFVVQIGAFAKAEKAQVWQKKFSKRGFRVYTEEADNKVRVRLGPYATREVAEKLRHKLQSEGLHPDVVELTE